MTRNKRMSMAFLLLIVLYIPLVISGTKLIRQVELPCANPFSKDTLQAAGSA